MHPDLAYGWRCMVCGADRAFHETGVAHRPLAQLAELFPDARVNVQYCLDRAACVAYANAPGAWPGPPTREAS